jgi:hypothetical protein
MTDEERKIKAYELKAMMECPGGQMLFKHIEDEITSGWNEFIDLPVDKKTSKAAFSAQSRYIVLKGVKEWVESEIRLAE